MRYGHRLAMLTAVSLSQACSTPAATSAQASRTDSTATAPDPDRRETRLAALAAKYGVVVVRGASTVGTIRGMYGSSVVVDAREFAVAGGEVQRGLTVTVVPGGTGRDQQASFVDVEEVSALLAGLDYIAKLDGTATKLDRFEATYATRGDLRVTVYTGSDGKLAFAVAAGTGLTATAFFDLKALMPFRTAIDAARMKLEAIK